MGLNLSNEIPWKTSSFLAYQTLSILTIFAHNISQNASERKIWIRFWFLLSVLIHEFCSKNLSRKFNKHRVHWKQETWNESVINIMRNITNTQNFLLQPHTHTQQSERERKKNNFRAEENSVKINWIQLSFSICDAVDYWIWAATKTPHCILVERYEAQRAHESATEEQGQKLNVNVLG